MAQLKDSVVSGNLAVTDDAYIGNARVQHVFDGGTGTVGRDAGSGNSPRYFPSKWIFDENINLVNGTTILIRVPVNGITYGVFLSLDNGATFIPIVHSNATRLQTQYTEGALVELMYDAEGSVAIYGLDGSDATETITGGVWRLSTCAYTNTTYSAMSTAEVTAGTASSARTMQARYLSAGLKAAITKGTNTVPGQFTVYGQTVNTMPTTASDNGKVLTVVDGAPSWAESSAPDMSVYAPKADPEFSGSISLYRKSGSTVGINSVAAGTNTEAAGLCSQAVGFYTKATGKFQHVSGKYNAPDVIIGEHDTTTTYYSGEYVYARGHYRDFGQWNYTLKIYKCTAYHTGDTPTSEGELPASHWQLVYSAEGSSQPEMPSDVIHVEIVGIGMNESNKKNGRTLDWNGNEEISGSFTCKSKITIGNTTITESQLQALLALIT